MAKALSDFDLVIFDCDGVLVDSEVLSCDCLGQMLRAYGYQIDLQGVFEKFLGRSFSIVEDEYRLALGYPLTREFLDAHGKLLRERFAASLQAMPGVERVLDGLQRRFCVASSSDRERLSFSLDVTGLAGRFGERVYSSDLVTRGKPAPDLFLHAAAAMGAEPSAALVIEDSVNGVRAGKAAGMTVWGYVGGSHYAERDGAAMLTEAGADRIFRDMAALRLS